MPNLTDSDLRDPAPPVPGARERAAVATRAHQLGRRRRILQGAGALGMVAAVAVGVTALTAGGTSPGTGQRIEAASSAGADAPSGTATTTTPAPATTTVPAPAPSASSDASTSAAVEQPAVEPVAPTVAAPTVFTVSGTVGNIPEGVTLTLTLSGPGGTYTTTADGSGHFAIGGVPAGDYTASYEWVSTDGTATQVGKLGSVNISGDTDASFSLQ